MHPILEVRNLNCVLRQKSASLPIVRDVSFSLAPNSTLAVVGESGSGKTTMALSLLRLKPLFQRFELSGEVLFEGKNLLTLGESELRKIRGGKISMIFQDPASALNPVFSIGQQVAETLMIHEGKSVEEAEERAIETLDQVGLGQVPNLLETYPHELSGGMKQRAMIASAIITNPKIIIADEPTTALDLTVQKEILTLLGALGKQYGMALLVITHDIGVVAEMADFVAVMYAGSLVEFGSTLQVFEKPLHPYTKALFEARPKYELRKKRLTTIGGMAPSAAHIPPGCPFHPRCPFAMEKCKSGPVVLKTEDNHRVVCWLYE
jgi:oligopeptide/dipeptide ABC transporter ATP-binding protein